MNILLEYNLKIQINLIFTLTNLYNFIKDHCLENTNYFETENDDTIIQSKGTDNLSLGNFLITSTQINNKKI